MKKYILIGFLAIIIIGGGVGYYMFNKKVPTLEDTTPDFVTSSNDLFNEFDNNEAKALIKYENKVIEVTGEIISVKNNEKEANIIIEADMAMVGGVNCSFKHKLDNNKIETGKTITIKGQCQGFLMDVILNNCQIIQIK